MRIAALKAELAVLEQQQREELVQEILLVVGPDVVFSAGDLWQHQSVSAELQRAFVDAGITSKRSLGKKLQQLTDCGIVRIDEDRHGVLWAVVRPE